MIVLILDERLSAFCGGNTQVQSYIESARERKLAVIFITHNVHQVYMVADSYTIIRQGRNIGTYRRGTFGRRHCRLITGAREC